MLPATMMPEILLGRLSNPALEHAGAVGDDAVHVRVLIASLLYGDALEAGDEAAVGLAERHEENDRRSEPEREGRSATRRLGEAAEELHPRRGKTCRALIHHELDHGLVA